MPMFKLVRVYAGRRGLERNAVTTDDYDEVTGESFPVLFPTADAATAYIAANCLNFNAAWWEKRGYMPDEIKAAQRRHEEQEGIVQLRPVPADADWRERERTRLTDGTYLPLPWAGETWWAEVVERYPDHFAHASTQEPGKLAYTKDETHGALDKQQRVRPGAYLNEYVNYFLSSGEIKHWALAFSNTYEKATLKFADTADEIERIYLHGPSSCMSHRIGEYPGTDGVHPVRAYAAGDLAVAYLEGDNGHPTARAICWPARKLYTRCYGDKERLEYLLENAGFANKGEDSLNGAKLALIYNDHGDPIVPYVDWHQYGVVKAGYIEIGGEDGDEVGLQSTDGCGGRADSYEDADREDDTSTWQCNCCGLRYGEDDSSNSVGQQIWCESCTDNNAVWIETREAYYPTRQCSEVEDTWFCDEDLSLYCVSVVTGPHSFNIDWRIKTGDWGDGDYVLMANGSYWDKAWFDEAGEVNADGQNVPKRIPGRLRADDFEDVDGPSVGVFEAGDYVKGVDVGGKAGMANGEVYVVERVYEDAGARFCRVRMLNGEAPTSLSGFYVERFARVARKATAPYQAIPIPVDIPADPIPVDIPEPDLYAPLTSGHYHTSNLRPGDAVPQQSLTAAALDRLTAAAQAMTYGYGRAFEVPHAMPTSAEMRASLAYNQAAVPQASQDAVPSMPPPHWAYPRPR